MGTEDRFISLLFSVLTIVLLSYFAGWLFKKLGAASQAAKEFGVKAKKSLGEFTSHDYENDQLYAQALRELREGTPDEAIWARAYMDASGETNRAEALYIKYRVRKLSCTESPIQRV